MFKYYPRICFFNLGPPFINAGKREVFQAHKTAGTATGSSGRIGLKMIGNFRRKVKNGRMEEKEYHFYIKWSAPYSFDFYSNRLDLSGYWAYKETYIYKYMKEQFQASGHDYYYDMNSIEVLIEIPEFQDSRFKMIGNMGTDHHPTVTISILPMF